MRSIRPGLPHATLVAGVAFVTYALWITHRTFHPLPPGVHVDGRGFLTPFIIVPTVAVDGLLCGFGVLRIARLDNRRAIRWLVYPVAAAVATSGPVAYMVFLTGPDIISDFSAYYVWYAIALLVAVLGTLAGELAGLLRSRFGSTPR